MQFIWDTRRSHRINLKRQGLEIVRGCIVKGIPIADGVTGTDPEVFIKVIADSQCPRIGFDSYPTTVYPFSHAWLEEINPVSDPTMGADQARVEFVYRVAAFSPQQGQAIWTLTDGGQGSYAEANGTATGSRAIWVWYKKGEPGNTATLPGDAPGNAVQKTAVRGVHRFFPQRTIRVTTRLLAADWALLKASLRLQAGYINSTQWGPSATDARGTWLFLFPTSHTTDYGRSFSIEVNFLQNPDKWFPLGLYYDRHGNHPPDSATKADLAAAGAGGLPAGPPAFDLINQRNGIVQASVYREFDFNSVFNFDPTD